MELMSAKITAYEKVIEEMLTDFQCDKLIVTGSYALYRLGLCKDFEDLDIVLENPTPVTLELLDRRMENAPAKTKPMSEYEDSNLYAIYMRDGIKIDVFLSNKCKTIGTDRGYALSTVDEIISAKLRANRIKDWKQLRKMALRIFPEKSFMNYLEN